MDIKRLLSKAKDVKPEDYLSFFPMLAALIVSPFYKKKYKDTWGISERKAEAKDNSYHFFKYMTSHHPEQKCIYTIDKKSKDFHKVCDLGETVQFGSIKHWILYFTCPYLISSQTFKPNAYMCTFLERSKTFLPNHVFLQHGITKDKAEFLLASSMHAKYFIAGAKPEYEFMKKEFGYPDGTMQYTGFARFDALHSSQTRNNRILIMPTWRKWLRLKSETHDDAQMDLESSEYINCWRKLLQNSEFKKIIDQYNLEVIFYPHPNMKGILSPETIITSDIRLADIDQEDLQELLKTSGLLITDFSSVFFDMAYMKKPVIFYQFDEEKYRKYHYQQGWFDYHHTAFGNSYSNADDVIDELKKIIEENYEMSESFETEHRNTFPLYDTNNCERIYNLLIKND